ncbi:MurR/RpiR family transcriptional regulator, partial [Clostridioides difficile]
MIIELNKSNSENLTKTELEIIKFINENESILPELSIVEIA